MNMCVNRSGCKYPNECAQASYCLSAEKSKVADAKTIWHPVKDELPPADLRVIVYAAPPSAPICGRRDSILEEFLDTARQFDEDWLEEDSNGNLIFAQNTKYEITHWCYKNDFEKFYAAFKNLLP